jgi:hypothetical protein
VICEHVEPWWNDIDRGKFLIRSPKLSGNPTSSHHKSKQKKLGKENDEFRFRNIFFHGAKGFTSLPKEGVIWIFIALNNPSLSTGSEIASLGSNGKHANHYITKDDFIYL